MFSHPVEWVAFGAFVLLLLVLDLGVFNRKTHVIHFREALLWSLFWISISMLFNGWVYLDRGPEDAVAFFTGYLIEKSLSVDNLFVFVLIFKALHTPAKYQHRVLYWGIVGAFAMRAAFIFAGIAAIQAFHWTVYIFGAFLVVTGAKLAFQVEKEVRPEQNPVLRFAKRFIPVAEADTSAHFFVRLNRSLHATPLFVALLLLETTDLIFATDSIPAILAISTDPYIVFTSNVFAILGLRSLYFALAGIMDMFHYLKYGLSLILMFVGMKMLLVDVYKVPVSLALGVVAGILGTAVLASVVRIRRQLARDSK
jgi:tellurite resistance protein TerC